MKTKLLLKSLLFVLVTATSSLASAQATDQQGSAFPWQPSGSTE